VTSRKGQTSFTSQFFNRHVGLSVFVHIRRPYSDASTAVALHLAVNTPSCRKSDDWRRSWEQRRTHDFTSSIEGCECRASVATNNGWRYDTITLIDGTVSEAVVSAFNATGIAYAQ